MNRRLPTLADSMVVAISPGLIMAMVGSLVFFLIAAFHNGDYPQRLCYISALFVFAAVLIARIAMEQGRAYAFIYSFFLGLAVLLAMGRFSDTSLLFNIVLIGLIWWGADKLTWDCTLVDESKDPSNQGLLRAAGLEGEPDTDEATSQDPVEGTENSTPPSDDGLVAAAMNDPEAALRDATTKAKSWWEKKRRRPNKPGVWVVYFSLAALPLFGFGQWGIGPDPQRRWHAFVLLCVYLASGFGLLTTTSFLGLRHYLRRRQVEMPPEMAGVWLGAGAAKIVVLLMLVAAITSVIWFFPATAVENGIVSWFKVGSPDNITPNRYGFGNDGPQSEEPTDRTGRQGERGQGEKRQDSSGSGGQQGKSGESKNSKQSSSSGSESKSKSKDPKQSQGGGDSQKKSGQQSSKQSQGGGKDKQQNGSKSEKSKSQQSKSGESSKSGKGKQKDGQDKQKSGQEKQQGESKSGEQKSGEQKSGEQKSDSSQSKDNSKSENDKSENDKNNRDSQNRDSDSDRQKNDQRQSSQQQRQNDQRQNDQRRAADNRRNRTQSGQSQSPRPSSSSNVFSRLGSWLGPLVKFFFWLVIAGIIAAIVWFYWKEIVAAWQQFLDRLRRFWETLFGKSKKNASAQDLAPEAAAAPPRPFSDFANPFTTGAVNQQTPQEIVHFTLEAFEAWAREHGCARDQDRTVHEFAAEVGQRNLNMAQPAQIMAHLYSQAAYAPDSIGPSDVGQLRQFWQHLEASYVGSGERGTLVPR